MGRPEARWESRLNRLSGVANPLKLFSPQEPKIIRLSLCYDDRMASLNDVFLEALHGGAELCLRLVNGGKAEGNVTSVGDDYVVIEAANGRQHTVPFTGIAEVTTGGTEFRFTFVS